MYYTAGELWMIECMMTHGAHCAFNLFEGNYATSLYMDFIHGSGSRNTAFRNRLVGWEPGKTLNTFAVSAEATNHYINVVGNLLGKAGYHNVYECANGDCKTATAVYYLGYRDTHGDYPAGYDPTVPGTILRHGNYDVATGGIKWDSSIDDHQLPDSYIYVAKPGWFRNLPWPPYDPANPSSDSPTNIPAGYRFVFGHDPPPLPPTNLRFVNP